MLKERDHFFDNAKFALIALVVLAHSSGFIIGENLYVLIYTFHMPCFIYISGYLSRNKSQQKIYPLIYPYVVFQLLNFIYYKAARGLSGPIQFTDPYYTLWFLFATAAWRVVTPFALRLKKAAGLILFFVIALLAGYDNNISGVFSISRIIAFFPFYLLGMYTPETLMEKMKKCKPYFAVVPFLAAFVLLKLLPPIPAGLYMYSISYEATGFTEWYAAIYRLLFYVAGIVLIVSFLCFFNNKKTWFSGLGARTLQVYLLHGLILQIIRDFGIVSLTVTPLQKTVYLTIVIVGVILLSTKPVEILMVPFTNIDRLKAWGVSLTSRIKKADIQG